MQNQVHALVVRAAGLGADDCVLAAISGGPDSVTLLDALLNVRGRGGPRIHVAHFDHCLRDDSAAVAEAVTAQARAAGLAVTVGRPDRALTRRPRGTSLEMAAREARWRFLRAAAAAAGALRIATGHTEDDQVESVLMNLARGSGARGLAGMRADDGEILRPLLENSRATVRAYLEARGLPCDEDPANASSQFRRNRVRHELLPLLESIYPGARAAIARNARVLAGDSGGLVAAATRGLRMPVHPQRVAVRPGRLPEVLQESLRALRPDAPPLGAAHIAAVSAAFTAEVHGRWVQLPGRVWAFVRHGALALYSQRFNEPAWPRAVPLPIPGVAQVPGARIFARYATRGAGRREYTPRCCARLDARGFEAGAHVRAPRAGERFRPLGARRARDLLGFLKSRGLPVALRAGTPVVEVAGQVAWVVGVEIGDAFAVRPNTERFVHLEVLWEDLRTPGSA